MPTTAIPNHIKAAAKRRARRVWDALDARIEPMTVVRHKLRAYSNTECQFDWKDGLGRIIVRRDKLGRVSARRAK